MFPTQSEARAEGETAGRHWVDRKCWPANLATIFIVKINLILLHTDDEIEPSASPDNVLHMIISCGEAKADDEDDDVVEIIAEVHEHGEEPKIAIWKCRPQDNLHYSYQDTRN